MRWLKVFCLNFYYISFILSLTLVNTDLTASATLYIFAVRLQRRPKYSQQFLIYVIRYPNYNKIYHCLTSCKVFRLIIEGTLHKNLFFTRGKNRVNEKRLSNPRTLLTMSHVEMGFFNFRVSAVEPIHLWRLFFVITMSNCFIAWKYYEFIVPWTIY